MTHATLSVVMPNYNHAHYIPHSLGALLDQSVRPDEIVVVDDASTDNSVEVIEGFAKADPLVRLVRNDRNRGVIYTLRRGAEESTGDYVFFPAADDYVLPGFVEKSMGLLAQHPHAGISCGFGSVVDGVTGEVSANPFPWGDQPCYLAPEELAARIGGKGYIPGHNAVIRRDRYWEAGGHLPGLKWISDWFLNLTVAFRHGLCFIPESIALFRLIATSYSRAGFRDRPSLCEIIRHAFDLLQSPAYADVLGLFRKSGVMGQFDAAILFAAAELPDRWGSHILPLVNCLPAREYQNALDDEDVRVRELAGFFARTLAPGEAVIHDLQETLRQTRQDLHNTRVELQSTQTDLHNSRMEVLQAQNLIKGMESTKFWKMRMCFTRAKLAIRRIAFR